MSIETTSQVHQFDKGQFVKVPTAASPVLSAGTCETDVNSPTASHRSIASYHRALNMDGLEEVAVDAPSSLSSRPTTEGGNDTATSSRADVDDNNSDRSPNQDVIADDHVNGFGTSDTDASAMMEDTASVMPSALPSSSHTSSVDTQAESSAVPATDTTDSTSTLSQSVPPPVAALIEPSTVGVSGETVQDITTPASSRKRVRRADPALNAVPASTPRALILTPEQLEQKKRKLSKGYALVPLDSASAGEKPEDLVIEGKRTRRTRTAKADIDSVAYSTPKQNGRASHAKRAGADADIDDARQIMLRTKLDLLKHRLAQVQADPSIVAQPVAPVFAPAPAEFSTPAPVGRGRGGASAAKRGRAKASVARHTPAPKRPRALDVSPAPLPAVLASPPSIVPVPLTSPYGASLAAATPLIPSTPSSNTPTPSPTLSGSARVTSRSQRQIKTPKHLDMNRIPPEIADAFRRCKEILLKFHKHKHAYPFLVPVDWQALNIPNYPLIIQNPMDLGTVRERLEKGHYETIEQFKSDVDLVWQNAMTFNPPDHLIHNMASVLRKEFDEQFTKVVVGGLEKRRRKAKTDSLMVDLTAAPVGSTASKTPRPRGGQHAALTQELAAMKQSLLQMQEQLKQATSKPARSRQPAGPLTFAERNSLKEDISGLPQEKLMQAIEIINQHNPGATQVDGEDLEIDFDQLNTQTCRKLQRFIKSARGRARGGGKGRGAGRGRAAAPDTSMLDSSLTAHNAAFRPEPTDPSDPSYVSPSERLSGLTTSQFAAPAPAASPESDSSDSDDSESDDEGSKKRKYPQPGMGFAAFAGARKKKARVETNAFPFAGVNTNQNFGDPSLFSAAPIDIGSAASAFHTGGGSTSTRPEVAQVEAGAWSSLVEEDALNPSPAPTGGGSDSTSRLWSNFKSQDEELKLKAQRDRERAEQEDRARRERDAERKLQAERQARFALEQEVIRKQQEQEREVQRQQQLGREREAVLQRASQGGTLLNQNMARSADELEADLEEELFGEGT